MWNAQTLATININQDDKKAKRGKESCCKCISGTSTLLKGNIKNIVNVKNIGLQSCKDWSKNQKWGNLLIRDL